MIQQGHITQFGRISESQLCHSLKTKGAKFDS